MDPDEPDGAPRKISADMSHSSDGPANTGTSRVDVSEPYATDNAFEVNGASRFDDKNQITEATKQIADDNGNQPKTNWSVPALPEKSIKSKVTRELVIACFTARLFLPGTFSKPIFMIPQLILPFVDYFTDYANAGPDNNY